MAKIVERRLTIAETGAISQYAANGMDLLGYGDEFVESISIVRGIQDYVEVGRQRLAALPESEMNSVVRRLGALWGQQVQREYAWAWVALAEDDSKEVFALVSQDRSYYAAPFALILKHLRDIERENTIVLAFNMLHDPDVPTAHPGRYLGLG